MLSIELFPLKNKKQKSNHIIKQYTNKTTDKNADLDYYRLITFYTGQVSGSSLVAQVFSPTRR